MSDCVGTVMGPVAWGCLTELRAPRLASNEMHTEGIVCGCEGKVMGRVAKGCLTEREPRAETGYKDVCERLWGGLHEILRQKAHSDNH